MSTSFARLSGAAGEKNRGTFARGQSGQLGDLKRVGRNCGDLPQVFHTFWAASASLTKQSVGRYVLVLKPEVGEGLLEERFFVNAGRMSKTMLQESSDVLAVLRKWQGGHRGFLKAGSPQQPGKFS
jgi:hypothetical protein